MKAKGKIRRAELSVVVTRADGRVDDYGVVGSSSLWFRLVGWRLAARRTRRLNEEHNGN